MLLSIRHFSYYPERKGIFIRQKPLLNQISLFIEQGEVIGVIGESGSGKSLLAKGILNLLPGRIEGNIFYYQNEISYRSEHQFAPYREKLQILLQNSARHLDPRRTVLFLLTEKLSKDFPGGLKGLLNAIELPGSIITRYAHMLSNEERERVALGRVLARKPEFLVIDSPGEYLGLTARNEFIALLENIKEEYQLTYLFISNNISMVRYIAGRIAILYKGFLVEIIPREFLPGHSLHPYSRYLLNTIPDITGKQKINPTGDRYPCPYSAYCSHFSKTKCDRLPPLKEVRKNHFVACFHIQGRSLYNQSDSVL